VRERVRDAGAGPGVEGGDDPVVDLGDEHVAVQRGRRVEPREARQDRIVALGGGTDHDGGGEGHEHVLSNGGGRRCVRHILRAAGHQYK
jgi:hypothetical protein